MKRAAWAILTAVVAALVLSANATAHAEALRHDVLLSVTTKLGGATLDATRTGITERLERPLYDIPGAEIVIAITRAGQSTVFVKLRTPAGADGARSAASAVLERLKPSLPAGIEGPQIVIPDPATMPAAYFALGSDTLSGVDVTRIARRNIVEGLQAIPHVSSIRQHGLRFDMTVAALDPQRLEAHKLTRDAVEELLRTGTGYSIEVVGPNELAVYEPHAGRPDLELLASLVLKVESGATVRLRDIAIVKRGMRAPEDDVRVNGRPSFLAEIFVSGTTLPEATLHIRDSLPAILRPLPAGMDVRIVYTCAACAERRR